MIKVIISDVAVFDPIVRGIDIKGLVICNRTGADNFVVTLSVYKSNGDLQSQTDLTVTEEAMPFTVPSVTDAGSNYRIVAQATNSKDVLFDVLSQPISDDYERIHSVGFIPVTSVGSGEGGLAFGNNQAGLGKTYTVLLRLVEANMGAYRVHLKLGFTWNGTSKFNFDDILQLGELLDQSAEGEAVFNAHSKIGIGKLTIGFLPTDYPNWTFNVLAIPVEMDISVNLPICRGTPIIECAALH